MDRRTVTRLLEIDTGQTPPGRPRLDLADRFFEKTCPDPNTGRVLRTARADEGGFTKREVSQALVSQALVSQIVNFKIWGVA